MKFKKSRIQENLKFLILTFMLVLANCSKKVNVGLTGTGEGIGEDEYPPTSVAVKNYDQVNATFSEVTGIPKNNQNIRNTFAEVKQSLAISNDIVSLSAPVHLANFKLAQSYCRVGANTEQFRAGLFPDVNFTQLQNPIQQFNQIAGIKTAIVRHLMNKFWGSGISTVPENAEAEFLALFDELIAGVQTNQNNSGQSRSILIGMCTAVLSASVLTLF